MNIQTGIAVTLAVIVVGIFFLFPNLSPFRSSQAGANTDQSATATQSMNTLQATDETVGSGAVAEAGDTVTVNYVGMLDNGTVFDASANHGQPFSFTLGVGQVIPGWDQGVAGMKEGGKRKLVIPSDLAYGANGIPGVIPANATLTFEVELVKVTKK